MAENTNIQWCDSTFNPWIGCTKISVGEKGACESCYAEVATPARTMGIQWGPGKPRHRTSPSTWAQPARWERNAAAFYAEHRRRQRVFCASLADVFDNAVDPQWRADLMRLIVDTPHLDWLVLTKRIGNVPHMIEEAGDLIDHDEGWQSMWGQGAWPDNVWLGDTVVTQEEANRDIPKLLAVPARVRFLSIEPMLGPIDLTRIVLKASDAPERDKPPVSLDALRGWYGGASPANRTRIDWVITGGESGSKARPSHPDWFRSLRDQCRSAEVAFHFKQHGEWIELDGDGPTRTVESDQASYDAESARCDGFVSSDGHFVRSMDDARLDVRYRGMIRLGKRAAGRLLDGCEHNDSPRTA